MDKTLRGSVYEFFAQRGKTVSGDTVDLFESEIIDSMELMEFLLHLEETHNITIAQEQMTVDNFRTVDAIVRTIEESAD